MTERMNAPINLGDQIRKAGAFKAKAEKTETILRTIVRQMHEVASEDDVSGWEGDRSGYLDEIALQYDYTDGAPTISRDALEAYVRAFEVEDEG